MKRILVRILLCLILVAIVLGLLNAFYYDDQLSPIWGDKYLIGKQNYLYKNKKRYNTLFLGSSKTHYQINPLRFDSLVNATGVDSIHSYNFGIDGMLPPESFYVCRKLLEDDKLKLKNLVIELDFIKNNPLHGSFSWRSIYWVNPDTYSDYTSAMMNSISGTRYKAQNIAVLNAMWLRKLFHPTKYRIVDYYRLNRTVVDSSGKNGGFEALIRETPFMRYDSVQINNKISFSNKAFENFDKWSKAQQNEAFASQLSELAELAESKGIRVFYFFPAQWSVELYQELFPILYHLPANSKLIMANVKGHEEIFKADNFFDGEHTNARGAQLFTTYMANDFIKAITPAKKTVNAQQTHH